MDYVEKNKNNSCSIVHARIDVTRISSSFYIRFDRFIPYKYVNLFAFAPRCLKKRGSYISSMNVNEEIFGDESGWISRRGGGNISSILFFFFLQDVSPDGIPGRSEAKLPGFSPFRPPIRDPPIRYRRNTRYIPPSPRPESTGENITRGQEVTQWRWPTYTPTIFPSAPAISSLLYDSPSLPLPFPSSAARCSWQFYFLSAATRFPDFN